MYDEQRFAAQQELTNLCECLGITGIILAAATAIAATGAARGALSSTFGYDIVVNSKQPYYAPVTQYTAENSLYSNVVGGIILSEVSFWVLFGLTVGSYACIIANNDDMDLYDKEDFAENCCDVRKWKGCMQIHNLACTFLCVVPANTILSVLDAVVGGLATGLIPVTPAGHSPHSNFAAAVGATGGFLSALAVFALLLVARVAYLIVAACQPENGYSMPKLPVLHVSMPKLPVLHAFKSSTNAARADQSQNVRGTEQDIPVATVVLDGAAENTAENTNNQKFSVTMV